MLEFPCFSCNNYRVERKKARLVDRFSDELLRGLTLFPQERGEMWDVPLLLSLQFTPSPSAAAPAPQPPHRARASIQVKGFNAAVIDNEEER